MTPTLTHAVVPALDLTQHGKLPALVVQAAPAVTPPAPVPPFCDALDGQCNGQHEAENPERHVGPLFHVALTDDPRDRATAEAQLIKLDPEPGFPLQHEVYVEFGGASATLTSPQQVAEFRAGLATFDRALLERGEQLAALTGKTPVRFDVLCGERRPGAENWLDWPDDADLTLRLACDGHHGHQGDHTDILDRAWPQQAAAGAAR